MPTIYHQVKYLTIIIDHIIDILTSFACRSVDLHVRTTGDVESHNNLI
jgi:hypothetical protein